MEPMKCKLICTLLFALVSFSPNLVFAKSTDRDQPIHIKADNAEINDKTGVSTYRGKVEITQGSMILRGDIVVIHAPGNKVEKVTAEGKLANYQQTTDDGHILYAEAEKMIYQRTDDTIELIRKAKLTEEENVFRSDRILYHIDKRLVDAGDPKGGQRVNITIVPDSAVFENNAKP